MAHNYRATYFKTHSPVCGRYQCVYCGKWKAKKDITIDHLLPQNMWRKIRTAGYISSAFMLPFPLTLPIGIALGAVTFGTSYYEHSRFNLVAACTPCNSSKSDRVDYRIIKGKLLSSKLTSIPYYTIATIVKVITFPLWVPVKYGLKLTRWTKKKAKRRR